MVNFNQIKADFAETMLMNPDVLDIDLVGGLLRVTVKDGANPEHLPETYMHKDGHFGIEYMTPGRLEDMAKHKAIETAALMEDITPGKPTYIKVEEYLQRQAAKAQG